MKRCVACGFQRFVCEKCGARDGDCSHVAYLIPCAICSPVARLLYRVTGVIFYGWRIKPHFTRKWPRQEGPHGY
jgi:hypothetical protein